MSLGRKGWRSRVSASGMVTGSPKGEAVSPAKQSLSFFWSPCAIKKRARKFPPLLRVQTIFIVYINPNAYRLSNGRRLLLTRLERSKRRRVFRNLAYHLL